ncbi:TssN family type VI secretion system protein [Salmonirosea aquatica]|uniref:Uncharacterized protein n=1 Tax=Salmonirosea aquatica TaxID=2654236 RepID=A0A7C9BM47_9BACT|nr:hypothetical protein [Cytophagaceae bacterium SJW1-29]
MKYLTFDLMLPALISLILGMAAVGGLFYLKRGTLSVVRVIIWIVWDLVLFAGLAFMAIKISSLNVSFLLVTLGAALLGILYLVLAPLTLTGWQRPRIEVVSLMGLALFLFGVAAFSLLYGLLTGTPISVFYFWVALLTFWVPILLVFSYGLWMRIPALKYKSWLFPAHLPVPRLHPVEPMRVTMNFTPLPTGKNGPFEGYEVEFPTNVSVGELFHYFISFHNKHREYSKKPIQYLNGKIPLEWVLYKSVTPRKKQYLDMDKTLLENQVLPNEHIYAYSEQ